MNIENLKVYINYGINKNQNRKHLISGSIALNLFACLGALHGFFYNQKTIAYSILTYTIAVIFIIWLSVLTRNLSFKKHIIARGIISLNAIMVFILNSWIFLEMLNSNYIYMFIFGIFPFIIAGFHMLIQIFNIKKQKPLKRCEIKRVNIYTYSTTGSIIGFFLAKTLFRDISQFQAIIMITLIFLVLSCGFSFGLSNFLRLYCIQKMQQSFNQSD